jgi:hypothetical protein
MVLLSPIVPMTQNHLSGIDSRCVRRVDLELTVCHLASRAGAHVTDDVDRVDVLFGLHRLARWFAEHGAQLVSGLLPLGSGQTIRANNEFAIRCDGNDQFGHCKPTSEADADGDGSVGCDLALDAGLVTTTCLFSQLVSFGPSIRGAQGR